MSFGLVYWVLMLFWLVFGFWSNWNPATPNYRFAGGHLLLFILLVILGWHAFGPPVHP